MNEPRTTLGPADRTFEAHHGDHLQAVARTVALTFGDLDLARRATDDAFVRTYDAWRRVSRLDAPVTWTYRAALRRAHRDARRARVVGSRPGRDRLAAIPELAAFHALVADLPQRQRIAVVLVHVVQMGDPDVAAVLRVRHRTLAALLRDAERALDAPLAPASVSVSAARADASMLGVGRV